MEKNKYLAISALGFFLTGCTGMTKNQAALTAAAACGVAGGGVGAAIAHQGVGGRHQNEAVGAVIGLTTGALLCGGLAYLLQPEPESHPLWLFSGTCIKTIRLEEIA